MTLVAQDEIPLSIDQLDREWFRRIIDPSLISDVSSAEVRHIIWGTATKVLVRLQGATDKGARLTVDLCVKGAFNPALREYYDLGVMFVVESAFYRDVASALDIRVPRAHYAAEDGAFGVLVLEDLVARGCSFATGAETLSLDRTVQALEVLASVHGATWGWRPLRFPWLNLGSASGRAGMIAMSEGPRYADLCARPEIAPYLPASYLDKERVIGAIKRLWDQDDRSEALCLGHGDPHIGQIYFDADGTPGMLDWQSAGLMPGIKDVAYLIGSALPVADRRLNERALIESYLAALRVHGGPSLTIGDVWDDYRAQMIQGFIWPLVTEDMQPLPVIKALAERFMSAMSDLDSLRMAETAR